MGLEQERPLEPEQGLYVGAKEGDPRHLADRERLFDIAEKIRSAKTDPAFAKLGRVAVTLAKYDDLRVVLIVLRKGTALVEHEAKGRITVHTIEGHARLEVGGEVVDLPAGRLLALDRSIRHDLEGVADSAVLLTIAL